MSTAEADTAEKPEDDKPATEADTSKDTGAGEDDGEGEEDED